MNDDLMQLVRERLAAEELHERENRQTLRHEILTIANANDAISVAVWAALLGTAPSIVWIFFTYFLAGWYGAFELLFGLLPCYLVLFALTAVVAGLVCGLFAHWWFLNSTISVNAAAIAIALLSDAVLFTWVLMLFR